MNICSFLVFATIFICKNVKCIFISLAGCTYFFVKYIFFLKKNFFFKSLSVCRDRITSSFSLHLSKNTLQRSVKMGIFYLAPSYSKRKEKTKCYMNSFNLCCTGTMKINRTFLYYIKTRNTKKTRRTQNLN